jgi:hypothetical protein
MYLAANPTELLYSMGGSKQSPQALPLALGEIAKDPTLNDI